MLNVFGKYVDIMVMQSLAIWVIKICSKGAEPL